MLKYENKKIIEVSDWDELVMKTYGRPYSYQQQDGCKSRGIVSIAIPDIAEDYTNEKVPEVLNHDKMGVSFKAWLTRDPQKKLKDKNSQEDYCLKMWYERNFYPNIQMIANDLHEKGLIEKGDYIINIDW